MNKYFYILIIIYLLLSCLKINANDYSDKIFEYIEKNDYKSLEEILQKGADPNVYREDYQNTPLLEAVYKGNIDIVKILIKYGADVECWGDFLGIDVTPFLLSIDLNSKELINYFLNNFNLNLVRDQGGQALISCAANNNLEIAKELIKKGAPVNYMTSYGQTPLIAAIYDDNINMVQLFLKNGANARMKIIVKEAHPGFDYIIEGQTLIEFAEEWSSQEVVDLLKSYKK